MTYRIGLLAITLNLWLVGCTGSLTANSPQDTPVDSGEPLSSPSLIASSPENLGQMLPISARVTLGEQQIWLEVARTPQQQALGLMYRTSLAPDRGMLFPFEPARPVGFWMKNVRIALDMIFLRNGEIIAIEENAPPCTSLPCPTYGPPTEIDHVIELKGGQAAKLGLEVGDRLEIEFIDPDQTQSVQSNS